mgnify:CR=1 FL=1
MPHAGAVRDLLANHAKETFVGRNKELALLAKALEQSVPPVSFVHAIGDIGKSRLPYNTVRPNSNLDAGRCKLYTL